ncbi:hypothetical protein QA649_34715 [Bradyrhizobium sp. CB1717]|uniref:hypothetical protein n=1 Tax=Bradyrhizobium sp. CB1717 TaxID=3039154 RepID=UPI0024B17A6B|nr:hypothetical protein [Bradyrhizobium sp. CB1717]WFU23188.1 hypothetical protein QA649_34715 [Bradyrhizobium sp. CB1717]
MVQFSGLRSFLRFVILDANSARTPDATPLPRLPPLLVFLLPSSCLSVPLARAGTVQLVVEARQFKPTLQVAFVINRKISNTAIGRDVVKALASFDIPVCDQALSQRVAYAESATRGLSVVEADPTSEAAKEIARLVRSLTTMNQAKAAA